VCALVNEEFLAFSKSRGNDLSTPRPEYRFAASNPATAGACARCAGRGLRRRPRPPVVLAATHEKVLEIVPLTHLREYAAD